MPFQALRPDLPMRLTPILHSPLFSYVWFGKYIRLVLRAYYIFLFAYRYEREHERGRERA